MQVLLEDTMAIDWNWFFAAYAQSAAALIGIIGAFTISKLLGESEKVDQIANELEDLIISHRNLAKRIAMIDFDGCDWAIIKSSSGVEEAIRQGSFNGLSEEEILAKLLEIEPGLFGTGSCLEALKEVMEDLSEEPLPGNSFSSELARSLFYYPSKEMQDIAIVKIESETMMDRFKGTQRKIHAAAKNLVPIRVTIYILMVGILLTVVYPLHFMPSAINEMPQAVISVSRFFEPLLSIKGLLLFLLAGVTEGIFGYFLALTSRIEHRYAELSEMVLDKYLKLDEYSIYFCSKIE